MKVLLRKYRLLAGIASVIIILDQWTKYLVRENIPFGGMWSPWDWLTPYARLVHWTNTGAAFGMFQNFGILFTILSLAVAVLMIYYFPQVPDSEWPLRIAMGMQLGGALGNLIDRLTIGEVTDFISVGNFAVFNIADSCITVGVAVLLIGMWWKDRQDSRHKQVEIQAAAQDEDPGRE